MTVVHRTPAEPDRDTPNQFRTDTTQTMDSRERTPWLLGFLCVLISILPAFVVPAGPLKSNGSPAKLLAVLFFGLAVVGFIFLRRTASTRTLRPGVAIVLVYFLLQVAVYGVGLTHDDSTIVEANKTRALIILVASVGVALYTLSRIRTLRQRNFVLGCLAIGLTFACLVALLQALSPIDLRFLFQPPGFVQNIDTENLRFDQRLGATRVAGTSLHPIEFSILAAISVPLTIYFARNAAARVVRWAAALACLLALTSMPAAGSRSGVVALAVSLFVYMWSFTVRQIATALFAGITAVGIYVAVFPNMALALWHAITGAREDDSIKNRIADYAQVSQTFHDHPVFGLGLGGAPPDVYGLLDNEWLRAIVQGGAVGVIAMILLAGGGIFGITAALRAATNRTEREQAYMLGAVFAAILSCSFTFDLFFYQQATFIMFMVFGLLWSNYTVPVAPGPEPATARPRNHFRA
jgi:O-antigen ligase